MNPERAVCFVINGEDVTLVLPKDLPLGEAKDRGLTETKNTGRPFADWLVRDPDGFILNDSTPLAELEVTWGTTENPHRGADSPLPTVPLTRLFLTLKVGAGGADGGTLPGATPGGTP